MQFFWARSRRRLGLFLKPKFSGVPKIQVPNSCLLSHRLPGWTRTKQNNGLGDFFRRFRLLTFCTKTVGFWTVGFGRIWGFPLMSRKGDPDGQTNQPPDVHMIKPPRLAGHLWMATPSIIPSLKPNSNFAQKNTLKLKKYGIPQKWKPDRLNQPFHVQGRTVLREGILLGQWLNCKLFFWLHI